MLLGAAAPPFDGRHVPLGIKGQAVDLTPDDHGEEEEHDEDGAGLDADAHVAHLKVPIEDGQQRELGEEDGGGPHLGDCLGELCGGGNDELWLVFGFSEWPEALDFLFTCACVLRISRLP